MRELRGLAAFLSDLTTAKNIQLEIRGNDAVLEQGIVPIIAGKLSHSSIQVNDISATSSLTTPKKPDVVSIHISGNFGEKVLLSSFLGHQLTY